MIEQLFALYTASAWWGYALRIASFFLIAWVLHRFSRRLAARFVRLDRLGATERQMGPQRRNTMQSLVASAITFAAFTGALLTTLLQFVDTTTLIWLVGLFSAGIGFAARPVLSDFLAGINLIFEDTFSVGEKVEIMGVEGMIEAVDLRATRLRAPNGELYVVPNGEIRLVRNFSRATFSSAHVKITIDARDLPEALALLEGLRQDAVALLPNLLEPWQVISESGELAHHASLTLLAKAQFGKAADLRPRLLALVQEHLEKAGIRLAD